MSDSQDSDDPDEKVLHDVPIVAWRAGATIFVHEAPLSEVRGIMNSIPMGMGPSTFPDWAEEQIEDRGIDAEVWSDDHAESPTIGLSADENGTEDGGGTDSDGESEKGSGVFSRIRSWFSA